MTWLTPAATPGLFVLYIVKCILLCLFHGLIFCKQGPPFEETLFFKHETGSRWQIRIISRSRIDLYFMWYSEIDDANFRCAPLNSN